MKRKLPWLFLIFYLLACSQVYAGHLIGGNATYACLGNSADGTMGTYRITFTMYKVCDGEGAALDPQALIGLFQEEGDGSFTYVETFPIPISFGTIEQETQNLCLDEPQTICYEVGTYEFEVELPVISGDYVFSYTRCCRNASVVNLVESSNTGASFSISISEEAQAVCNSSPVFDEFPNVLLCSGVPVSSPQFATDPDGDVLVYEFCSPKQGGGFSNASGTCTGNEPEPIWCPPPYEDVTFKLPNFSSNIPVPGNPALQIDNNTGIISGTPNLVGLFTVGVCVKEFRDGVLIGEMVRDFQFDVTDCSAIVEAMLASDETLLNDVYVINSCGQVLIDFENESTDEFYIDEYLWQFDLDGETITSSNVDPQIDFENTGSYMGQLIVNPFSNIEECKDTAFIEVNIFPAIAADFEANYDTCSTDPVQFINTTIGGGDFFNWEWTFEDGQVSESENPTFAYDSKGIKTVELAVTDENGCSDLAIKTFNYEPEASIIIIQPSSFLGCAPGQIFFNNLTEAIDSSFEVYWDFGDGNTSTDISPFHTYDIIGAYDVLVEITSPKGCLSSKQFNNLIEVAEKPEAGFSFLPEVPTLLNNEIQFTDESFDAVDWLWLFDDLGASQQQNPSFEFKDTGTYEVTLIAYHPSGCPDTISQSIYIAPEVTFHLPNAFSPNNDGTNDLFIGNGFTTGMNGFDLKIFNRYGELVFETDDPTIGWNGSKNNLGSVLQDGVYVYQLRYEDALGREFTDEGFATLIR